MTLFGLRRKSTQRLHFAFDFSFLPVQILNIPKGAIDPDSLAELENSNQDRNIDLFAWTEGPV
jgi:hypothetical protein